MQKMLVKIVIYLVVLSLVLCVIVLIYVATFVPFAKGISCENGLYFIISITINISNTYFFFNLFPKILF